ncbi:hypothetical protein [Streptomyces sp. NPDC126503]|uniref:hypothetical protein n=1 Tax=Streptomyces sp. NPDC126503 TaxID=3155315 RepID=UPI0033348C74
MSASTDTTLPAPAGPGLRQPAYGFPSSALLARADRGHARFLAQHTENPDHRADTGKEPTR